MKKCSKCGYTGPDSDFCKDRNFCKKCKKVRDKIYHLTHREEKNAKNKTYRLAHKKELKVYSQGYRLAHKQERKNYKLVYNFGITLDEHNQMYHLQQGCCAICNKPIR